jgi:CheY-like chemotaxis protein
MGSILIVDDDADLPTLLAGIIADQGHEVRTAANGREALDRVSERMPDLILLDIKMPVMSGPEFAARFRNEYGHAAHIVVMTAAESAAMRAQEEGADAWLSKPFALSDLFKILELYAKPPYSPGVGG